MANLIQTRGKGQSVSLTVSKHSRSDLAVIRMYSDPTPQGINRGSIQMTKEETELLIAELKLRLNDME